MSRTGILPRRVANIDRDYTGATKVVASSAISASDIVVVSGVSGSKMTVTQADADSAALRAPTLMVSPFAIPNGEVGAVVPWAIIKNVNTGGSAIGNAVYLSGTAGGWTLAGGAVRVGTVLSVHATTGVILLNPGAHSNDLDVAPGADGSASAPLLLRKSFAENTTTNFTMPSRPTLVVDAWFVTAVGASGTDTVAFQTGTGTVVCAAAAAVTGGSKLTRFVDINQAADSFAAGAAARIVAGTSMGGGTLFLLLQPE